ncbi:hypothetical protein V2J09_018712 [Rumex salicifolius]
MEMLMVESSGVDGGGISAALQAGANEVAGLTSTDRGGDGDASRQEVGEGGDAGVSGQQLGEGVDGDAGLRVGGVSGQT